MIQKSVRIPSSLVEFVDSQPGADFSKKLIGILTEYKNGELERKLMLQRYDEQIAERKKRLDSLMQKIGSVSLISRRVDALFEELETAEAVRQ
jgi:Arc/MetJ-type ribon-helix-helix transcriptional regulator